MDNVPVIDALFKADFIHHFSVIFSVVFFVGRWGQNAGVCYIAGLIRARLVQGIAALMRLDAG